MKTNWVALVLAAVAIACGVLAVVDETSWSALAIVAAVLAHAESR